MIESRAKVKTKQVTVRDSSPWINSAVLDGRRKLCKSEKIWRGGGYLEGHFASFKQASSQYSAILQQVKSNYLCSIVAECSGDQKKLYKVVDSWLSRKQERSLPSHQSPIVLAETFSSLFRDKVEKIRAELVDARAHLDYSEVNTSTAFLDTHTEDDLFTEFSIVTVEDVHRVITASPTTSCILRPIPTATLRKVAHLLVPAITSIVNLSLQTGIFLKAFKHGLVSPPLKKPGLDKEVLSNYRPITNLSFVSKVLERIVSNQLDEHFSTYDILSPSQSAYRAHDSTETALLSFQGDLLLAAGRGYDIFVLLAGFLQHSIQLTTTNSMTTLKLTAAFQACPSPGSTTT